MNMAGLGGWRGLSRALKCFGVRGFLRRVRQDHKVARCMAHNLARARKSESIRARIWYPGGYPGIPEDTRIREPNLCTRARARCDATPRGASRSHSHESRCSSARSRAALACKQSAVNGRFVCFLSMPTYSKFGVGLLCLRYSRNRLAALAPDFL